MTAPGDDIRESRAADPSVQTPASPVPPVAGPVGPVAWPYGPRRPSEATAAAVLGLYLAFPAGAGGLVGLMSLISSGNPVDVVLALGLPCAVGLAIGAVRLLRRLGRRLLVGSGAATAALLLTASLVDAELRSDGWGGVLAGVLLWLPAPLVTVWFAALPRVGNWIADRPPLPGTPLPYAPPPWGWPPELWPYGPPRPPAATSAAVLGLLTAGCTFWMAPFAAAISLADEQAGAADLALLLLVPCAAGMLAGALRLLHRRSRGLLLGSSLAAVTVLLSVLVAALVADPDGLLDLLAWAAFVLPLPMLTASYAARSSVRDWLAVPPC